MQMVCGKCRSAELTRDAWAEWNVEAQAWALGTLFDYAFCHRCQAATRVEQAPLAAGRPDAAGDASPFP